MPLDPLEVGPKHRAFRLRSYRLHKASGRAVVTLRGRNIYLGKYGSPESRAAYDRAMREFIAARGVSPAERSSLTVAEFVLIYWRHAKSNYPPAVRGRLDPAPKVRPCKDL